MRFSRLAAVTGVTVLVLGIASCSSTGRKAARKRRRNGRRHRRHAPRDDRDDHPRSARRLVLGPDPQGRGDRGEEGQHRAALLERSRGPQPGQPRADRDRQRRRWHRTDTGQARRDARRRRGGRGEGHSRRRVQRRWRRLAGDGCQGVLRSGRVHRGPGRRRPAQAGRREEGALRHSGAGPRRTRSPLRRCEEHLPGDREPQRQRQGHAFGRIDDHGQAAAGSERSTTSCRSAHRLL